MLAVQVFERDPLHYQDLPGLLASWAYVVGLVGLIGMAVWLLALMLGLVRVDWKRSPSWLMPVFIFLLAAAGVLYPAGIVLGLRGLVQASQWVKGLAGVCAILAASLGLLRNLPRLSGRRIWAITRLSFKEAMRRRVPWVFALILIVFLFANWYVPFKPEHQVRTYVGIVYFAMLPLLLLAAGILGAFSIPADIKQQTIHTIITKPVERFEIVLGRFLGFTALLTIILVVMTSLSLVYVMRNIDPEAAAESLRARNPAYGALTFEGTESAMKAESVGREWSYRSYIAGPLPGKGSGQAAVWSFPALPARVADRPYVRCEFAFDVYRLHVGTEGQNLSCSFVFTTHNFKPGSQDRYREQFSTDLEKSPDHSDKRKLEIANKLSEEFGYFEVPGKNVMDYHTLFIDVPGGLFRNALKGTPPSGAAGALPAIQVKVKNNSTAGYVGMARYDLYFLQDDPNGTWDALWFGVNFFKGALGLWFQLVLLCGLAVALSTYLSGVISLLITLMFYFGGIFEEFIRSVAEGTNFGGGPLEAAVRIAKGAPLSAPLEESAAKQFFTGSDQAFRYLVRGLLYLLPDVDRFSLTSYVAEGFDIPLAQLVLSSIILVGYLLPWGVLAFYLIKWREIAAQT